MRACRQTCRAWRDDIRYSNVAKLALHGVVLFRPVLPQIKLLPELQRVLGPETFDLDARLLATWWPGHRVIRPPGSPCSATRRCPACRLPAGGRNSATDSPVTDRPALLHFLLCCGVWNAAAVADALGVTTIAGLRQLGEAEILASVEWGNDRGLDGPGLEGHRAVGEATRSEPVPTRMFPLFFSLVACLS